VAVGVAGLSSVVYAKAGSLSRNAFSVLRAMTRIARPCHGPKLGPGAFGQDC